MKQTEEFLTFDEALKAYTDAGYEVISDGPSGIQLKGPKKMKGLDKACLAVGLLTFWIYGIGLFFIALAMVDYWFLTKPEIMFLSRN